MVVAGWLAYYVETFTGKKQYGATLSCSSFEGAAILASIERAC
jgi:hypothetical protein